ncbi:hypothetical protein L8V92_08215, partial [Campylobacter lari]|nr:hypothetical protein [Campylobacter lari]MCV3422380.1 hypothetical protein [Campylobacter lari]
DKIKLYQRELKFSGDKTIYTEENTQANITLSGGKSGEKVEWNLSGDATLGSHDTTFNRSGYAYATITSKAPFKANPIISVETIGQSVSTTIAYVDKEYIPSIVYPNYRGHEKTVNLNQDFNLEVSNLIPNTEIEIYHNILSEAQPKQDHVKVNSLGKATLEFNGVWTPTVDKFYIKFKYMKTKSKSADFSTDWIYVYKQDVKLVLDIDKDSFLKKEGEEAHATLKGGEANEKVEWSLNGDASLTKADKVFNASGEAKATITSKAPFKANPVISVKAMGKNLSKELKYKKIPIQLSFSKTVLNPLLIEYIDVVAIGTPNEKIKWSIDGDGILPREDLIPKYFDSEGFARTKFRTIDPDTRPITVSVEYEDGSGKASKMAIFDGPIRPRIHGQKIIPFDTGATIEVYGLVPNSTVEVQPDQYLGYINFINKGTLHSDNKGSVYLNFKPIGNVTQHTGRVFKLKVKYENWDGSDSQTLLGDIEVQKRIHAIYDTWKDPASCYTSATLTLTDGIPGEKVDFSGTKLNVGLGQTVPIIQRWDEEFDNSGEAKVIISTTWCTKPATETPVFVMRFNTLDIDITEKRAVTFGGGDHEKIY